MGTFQVAATIWQVGIPSRRAEVSMIIDAGATYTTLPSSLLRSLGVPPVRSLRLKIANGTMVERDIGLIGIDLGEGNELPSTPVVFGDEGIQLLGTVILEELSLAADTVNKKLVRADAYLLAATLTSVA
jgi:predicted aspartyl protease